MNKNHFFALIGLLAISGLSPVTSQAAGFGLQFANMTYEEDGFSEVEPGALIARLSSKSETFGYEGRAGFGISSGDSSIADKDLEIYIDSLLGAYLTAQRQFGPVSIYGLVGYTYIIATKTISGRQGPPFTYSSSQDDESGLSFGFGANFGQIADIEFNIEYMPYLDDDGISIDAISLGVALAAF
jgi:hypothetical protein